MNSVHFIGHVGQDPEFTTFQSGKQNARLTVAINNYRKDQEPIWVRCEFWEDAAERLKNVAFAKALTSQSPARSQPTTGTRR